MTFLDRLRGLFVPPPPSPDPSQLTSVTSRVYTASGWTSLTGRPHDYDPSRVQEITLDTLEAWRIIAITATPRPSSVYDDTPAARIISNFFSKQFLFSYNPFILAGYNVPRMGMNFLNP